MCSVSIWVGNLRLGTSFIFESISVLNCCTNASEIARRHMLEWRLILFQSRCVMSILSTSSNQWNVSQGKLRTFSHVPVSLSRRASIVHPTIVEQVFNRSLQQRHIDFCEHRQHFAGSRCGSGQELSFQGIKISIGIVFGDFSTFFNWRNFSFQIDFLSLRFYRCLV